MSIFSDCLRRLVVIIESFRPYLFFPSFLMSILVTSILNALASASWNYFSE